MVAASEKRDERELIFVKIVSRRDKITTEHEPTKDGGQIVRVWKERRKADGK